MKRLFRTDNNRIYVKHIRSLKIYARDGKMFASDEEWITINSGEKEGSGQHVLLNELGEVIAGAGGALKGRKFTPVKGLQQNQQKQTQEKEPPKPTVQQPQQKTEGKDDPLSPKQVVIKDKKGNEHTITRGNPMTHDEANGMKCNPFFRLGKAYQENCQTCVFAYEMRLRGYDVEARRFIDDEYSRRFSENPQSAWFDPKTGRNPVRTAVYREPGINGGFYNNLEKQIEKGKRYHLGMYWKGGGGHIVTVQRQERGGLMIYDPQSGRTYKGRSQIEKNCLNGASGMYYYRVDNAMVNQNRASRFLAKAGQQPNDF